MKKIIYFDGICNLCNWSVKFIVKHDKNGIFSFSALQSDYAAKQLLKEAEQKNEYASLVYQDGALVLMKSDAVFQILADFGGRWKAFLVFKFLPKSWCDGAYDIIAKNRYRWFGKSDKCLVPTRELSSRFLD